MAVNDLPLAVKPAKQFRAIPAPQPDFGIFARRAIRD
jgi:hypothetical protein